MGSCDPILNKNQINSNSEQNDRINEVELINSELKPIDTNIIKVSPSVCKIITNISNGTGFLILLNRNNNVFFCLMTNEHVITREMVQNEENITIKYDCERKQVQINLNNKKRLIRDFIDINIDATIIEILPIDNIEEHYFLLPETNINKNLINSPIYIPQYPKGINFCYSHGYIIEINNDEITHNSTTKFGSSGSPIFLENSTKVIAIHKQGNIKIKENYGNFLYPIIQELQKNIVNNNYNDDKKQEYKKINYDDGKYYIGPVLNGLPNGKGKMYYKNGNLFYEGDFKQGIKEGNGKIFYEDGEYYDGEFSNDQINGKGKYYYDNGYYEGDLINGKRHGKGKYYWENGKIYEGDWFNNLKEGYGKFIYEDGCYYIGFWFKDNKHGKGKQFYKDGTIQSDIDFVNDKYEGYGRYNYGNGTYYLGQWHNDLKLGKGKIYYKNGKIKFDGNFINDKMEGYGEYFWENGEYYKGNFKNGLFHGKGKVYYKNGSIKYEGDFAKDKFEGYGRYNFENGEYYIGQWSQDQMHGKGTLYNKNGSIKNDGFFFNGKFEG